MSMKTFPARIPCPTCDGETEIEGDRPWTSRRCPDCDEEGRIRVEYTVGDLDTAIGFTRLNPEAVEGAVVAFIADAGIFHLACICDELLELDPDHAALETMKKCLHRYMSDGEMNDDR